MLGSRQASLEEQIAASRARSSEIERRLYSGQVTAARDLQAMDEEVKHLARHVSELEDRELEVMEQLEPLDAELTTMDGGARRSGAQGPRSSAARSPSKRRRSTATSSASAAERARLAAEVPADLLARYEQLRAKLGGTGAARLVGGSCGGCHLQLPAMEFDRVKKATRRRDHLLRPVRPHPGEVTRCSCCFVTAKRSATPKAGCSGRLDSPLTDSGRAQAARLANLLERSSVARVITSPLVRARNTAEALDLDVADRDRRSLDRGRLRELRRRAVDGRSRLRSGARWRADPGYRPPGGETLAELGIRVRSACEELFSIRRRWSKGGLGRGRREPRVADKGRGLLGARNRRRHCVAHVARNGLAECHRWGAGTPVLRRYNIVSPTDGQGTA